MEQLGESVLLLHVFSRLQLQDLGRVRCVCRAWRSSIGSEEFARVWQFSGRPCCVLRIRPFLSKTLTNFDTRVWFPGEKCSWRSGLNSGPPGRLCLGITGSSHGLVCGLLVPDGDMDAPRWRTWISGRKWEFVVGNPVTNRWKALPPLPVPRLVASENGFVERLSLQANLNGEQARYQVALLCGGRVHKRVVYNVFSYDSGSGKWSSPKPFSGEEAEAGLDAGAAVFGKLGLAYRPAVLTAYNPASLAWSCHKRFFFPDEDGDDEALGPHHPTLFNDEDDVEVTSCCGVYGWKGRTIMVSHSRKYVTLSKLVADENGDGVWEVFWGKAYKELQGAAAGHGVITIGPHLVGDTVLLTQVFGRSPYSGRSIFMPIAYNLKRSTCDVYNSPYPLGSVDIEADFTFVPSFTAQP